MQKSSAPTPAVQTEVRPKPSIPEGLSARTEAAQFAGRVFSPRQPQSLRELEGSRRKVVLARHTSAPGVGRALAAAEGAASAAQSAGPFGGSKSSSKPIGVSLRGPLSSWRLRGYLRQTLASDCAQWAVSTVQNRSRCGRMGRSRRASGPSRERCPSRVSAGGG